MSKPVDNSATHGKLNRLIDLLAVIAGALLCALVLLICIDVTGRSSRAFSVAWTLDVSEFALYVITFFGAPWVLREQGHIAIELFVEHLPTSVRNAARYLADSLGVLICLTLLLFSARQWWRSFVSGNQVYETFVYPEWFQYAVAPPIFAILLILFWRRLRQPDNEPGRGEGI